MGTLARYLHDLKTGKSAHPPKLKTLRGQPAAAGFFFELADERRDSVRNVIRQESESRADLSDCPNRGSRPTAVRQTEYNDLWVIAAASPQTGQAEAILSPVLNTGIINQFLDQFSRSLADDVQAVMIWDGTGFHTAHDLPVPSNVTLIKLPPYSPELNGIENLWRYLRSHFWSNRVYLDYDDLFEVAESTWCKNCLNPELIKSVYAISYTQTRSELWGSVSLICSERKNNTA